MAKPTHVHIDRGTTEAFSVPAGEECLSFDQVKARLRKRGILKSLWSYPDLTLHTYRNDVMTKPLATRLLLRTIGRGRITIQDEQHHSEKLALWPLAKLAAHTCWDFLNFSTKLRAIARRIEQLEAEYSQAKPSPAWDPKRAPLYLRTDPWYGIRAGGSVAHISGVLNSLCILGPAPHFLTTDPLPTLSPEVHLEVSPAPTRFRDVGRMLAFECDAQLMQFGKKLCPELKPGFLYARYAMNSFAGVELSREFSLPYVLEYNGSELWINRNWGGQIKTPQLSERIELLNLLAADLIVVVSKALEQELLGRGIPQQKILVNPNGVDLDRCSPEIDGKAIRKKFGLDGNTVLGFIGSFGPWHGAEVLIQSFIELASNQPDVHLLMIGEGQSKSHCEQLIATKNLQERVHFTGRVAQELAPEYLAACDILVSPHVPNTDGSEFFGSPTKLYEYMAMGKAIVASELAQLAETLSHNVDAVLVPPANPEALTSALNSLIGQKEKQQQLGAAARKHAVQRHSWKLHTQKILDALQSIG